MARPATGGVEVRPVALEDVLPLRQRVLRPHQRVDQVVFDGDAHPAALHVGAFAHARLIGVATIAPEPDPAGRDPAAWRVRGMAVDDADRGRGVGGALLERCLAYARERGGTLVWCNARVRAMPFYEAHAFAAEGEPFDVPGIGPHVRMSRAL